jgi:hypothetical protein
MKQVVQGYGQNTWKDTKLLLLFLFFGAQTEKSIAKRRKYKLEEEPGGLPTLVAPSKSYTYHTESYQIRHSFY